MINFKKHFFVIILLFKLIYNQDGVIKLPFQKELPNLKDVSPKDVISKNMLNNLLLAELKVGTKPQTMKLRLEFDNYIFYIANDSSSSNIKFNPKNSKSFKQLEEKIEIEKSKLDEAVFSSDYLYFGNKKYEMNFLLGIKTEKDLAGGLIGLNLDEDTELVKYNFFNELKRVEAIRDYFFAITYTDNNSGNLIIGDLPHNYDEKFKKDNYRDMYAEFSVNDLTWKIIFNKIYLSEEENSKNQTKIEEYAIGYFRIEKSVIKGTEEYRKELMVSFMKEQIDKNLCFEETSLFYYSYYCKKEADISKLKNIYFYNKKLDFTFELTYKDLFFYNENDGYNYFLVIFSTELDDEDEIGFSKFWILGEPIFKKYQFVFNKNSKRIGVYTNIDNNIKKPSWASKNKWYIILIVILFILLCGLGSILYIFLKDRPKKRKIKANELDDEFEYTSDKNKLIN